MQTRRQSKTLDGHVDDDNSTSDTPPVAASTSVAVVDALTSFKALAYASLDPNNRKNAADRAQRQRAVRLAFNRLSEEYRDEQIRLAHKASRNTGRRRKKLEANKRRDFKEKDGTEGESFAV